MKAIAGFFLLLLLSANLHAQGRRPVGSTILNSNATTLFDSFNFGNFDPTRSSFGPHSAAAAPHADNLIPVTQLRIPPKAVKEYERAEKAFHSGDVQASADHLQKAVRIYPDFLQAHISLGLRFIQLGDYQKALAEQEAARALDPRNAQARQNLSFSLLLLNRFQESEAEARQSLDLDPELVAARYVLARAVIAQGHATPEAMEMLRKSEATFPDASLVLAQIHFAFGRTDDVIEDLHHYLRAPIDPENKQKAECWAAQLSKQPAPAGCPAQVTRPSFR
jgi:tetratricopeptide (TPR) repeat protein